MKKNLWLLLPQLLITSLLTAQNIGIGNTNPRARLDINGDIAVRSTDITISTTYTYALDVNTVKQSSYKLKSAAVPIGNFILAGINGGAEGRIITLTNRTGGSMEIYNEDATAVAANRIQTGTGTTIAVYPNGNVTLQYDGSDQRWSIKSLHNNSLDYFGGGGGTSSWDVIGTDIKNNNTGNVGIGTNSPSFKLDVSGNQRITGQAITAPGLNGSLTSGGSFRIENTSNAFFLKTDGSKIQAEKYNLSTTGTTASSISINPHGGNVGIGIDGDIPYKLSIYQPVIDAATTNTYVAQLRGQNPILHFVDQFNTSRGYLKGVTNRTGTPHFSREGIEIGAAGGDIYFTSAGYQVAMMINGTSNFIGIGTNTPNERLSVNGNIRSKEVVVEMANWPDYVFADNYQLPTLQQLENYISEHNHLPNMPAAKEIERDGLRMGDVQKKMMEKVEELTLYIIELKKEIDLLKAK